MHFIDARRAGYVATLALLALPACSPPVPPVPPVGPASSPSAQPATLPPAPAPSAATSSDAAVAQHDRQPLLPPPAVHTLKELHLQMAQRLVAANPERTYTGAAPDPLLAIPVLQVELNADGSVRRIEVLREPRQARDTTQLAIEAVRRAAPYGDVSRLPKPWKFTETFLFDDERRFKPRTLEP